MSLSTFCYDQVFIIYLLRMGLHLSDLFAFGSSPPWALKFYTWSLAVPVEDCVFLSDSQQVLPFICIASHYAMSYNVQG
jgi:hypothetical protein